MVGVICHHGTAGGGHYTSYGLNNGDQEWYEYDDSYVSKVFLYFSKKMVEFFIEIMKNDKKNQKLILG